jgi:hypothetical protein
MTGKTTLVYLHLNYIKTCIELAYFGTGACHQDQSSECGYRLLQYLVKLCEVNGDYRLSLLKRKDLKPIVLTSINFVLSSAYHYVFIENAERFSKTMKPQWFFSKNELKALDSLLSSKD